MDRIVSSCVVAVGLIVGWTYAWVPPAVSREVSAMNPTFTILFDNVPFAKGYRTSWGYSCLIRGLEKTILFDTGADGRLLLDNMEQAGIDPVDIDAIVLSHFHGDHTGGLHALLPRCEDLTVYVPRSFPKAFKDEVRASASEMVEVSDPVSITNGAVTTGVLSFQIPEQSLTIQIPDGVVVVTGCAHPGLVGICEKALDVTHPEPIFLMGGFHLRDFSMAEVAVLMESLQAMGVTAMMPGHCTGGTARHAIKKILGDRCLEGGAGRVLTTEEIRAALGSQ